MDTQFAGARFNRPGCRHLLSDEAIMCPLTMSEPRLHQRGRLHKVETRVWSAGYLRLGIEFG